VEQHIGHEAKRGIEVFAEHLDREIRTVEIGVAVNAGSKIVKFALDFFVGAGSCAANRGGGEEHDGGLAGRALQDAGAELKLYRDLGEAVTFENENFEAVG
jgi:hypothetical protein